MRGAGDPKRWGLAGRPLQWSAAWKGFVSLGRIRQGYHAQCTTRPTLRTQGVWEKVAAKGRWLRGRVSPLAAMPPKPRPAGGARQPYGVRCLSTEKGNAGRNKSRSKTPLVPLAIGEVVYDPNGVAIETPQGLGYINMSELSAVRQASSDSDDWECSGQGFNTGHRG